MLQYNADEHKLNEKVDLSASALVYGDIIISLIKYSDDSIIICGEKSKSALILSIPSMEKWHQTCHRFGWERKVDVERPQ